MYKERFNLNYKIESIENEHLGDIKAIWVDGAWWFIANNITKMLGLGNTTDAVKQSIERITAGYQSLKATPSFKLGVENPTNITIDKKKYIKLITIPMSGGKKRQVSLVNEEIMFDMILSSRKQRALKVRYWLTHEVLPSLREKGYYIHDWKKARLDGIVQRKSLMTTVYNTTPGNQINKWLPKHYTNLIYKKLQLPKGFKRDDATTEQLKELEDLETAVKFLIKTYDNSENVYMTVRDIVLGGN